MANGEAHVRIDEGIKRGPRRPQKRRRDPDRPQLTPQPILGGKLATADLNAILERYLADESTAAIAASLNVHRSALHQWLLRNAEEPWKQAQIARAITEWEEAKDQLQAADDALSLARARERLRSAQWSLERLFSRLFGPKQELTITDKTDLGERLRRARERVIEGECVAETPIAAVHTGIPAIEDKSGEP